MINSLTCYRTEMDKSSAGASSLQVFRTHRSKFAFSCGFPGDHIPLLRSSDDDLCLGYFRFGHLHIASQLSDFDREPLQPLPKFADDLSCQRLHGSAYSGVRDDVPHRDEEAYT